MGKNGQTLVDVGGRSFSDQDALKIIKKLQKKYGVVLMSEFITDHSKWGLSEPVAQPENCPLRIWGAAIKEADGFLGCDSVGQHLAHSLETPAVTVLGSTFQENVSYPDSDIFQVLDLGHERRRYDPIRISFEEEITRSHQGIMLLADSAVDEICKEVDRIVAKGAK